MSILIKGMKMPESCVDCPMFDWDLEYLKCKANDKYFKANGEWRKGIEPTCPLIEVPEDVQPVKHGRWIKARGSWCTPGGDPVWECSECRKGMHVYGIEHGTYGSDVADGQWVACPNCGAKMDGEV